MKKYFLVNNALRSHFFRIGAENRRIPYFRKLFFKIRIVRFMFNADILKVTLK